MSYNDKFIDNFKSLGESKFPDSIDVDMSFTCSNLNTDFRPDNQLKSSTKGEKPMNLVIKPDKYTIYQIHKDDIQELKHIPEQIVEGFAICPTMNFKDIYKPKYVRKEEWYVILKGGKRIDLTKKQYTIIKGWFKGEE